MFLETQPLALRNFDRSSLYSTTNTINQKLIAINSDLYVHTSDCCTVALQPTITNHYKNIISSDVSFFPIKRQSSGGKWNYVQYLLAICSTSDIVRTVTTAKLNQPRSPSRKANICLNCQEIPSFFRMKPGGSLHLSQKYFIFRLIEYTIVNPIYLRYVLILSSIILVSEVVSCTLATISCAVLIPVWRPICPPYRKRQMTTLATTVLIKTLTSCIQQ
jgi:hypothetical protein